MLNIKQISWPVWRVGLALLVFGLADLFLTWRLIAHDGSEVIESNPIAAKVLARYGWTGLAAFKVTLVTFIFCLACTVESRRPRSGMLLLVFACGVHAAVVTTSVFMCLQQSQTEIHDANAYETANPQRKVFSEDELALLSDTLVQAELGLTPQQKGNLVRLAQKRSELSREVGQANLHLCQSKLMLIALLEHNCASDLSPAQSRRLSLLGAQKRGLFAMATTANATE